MNRAGLGQDNSVAFGGFYASVERNNDISFTSVQAWHAAAANLYCTHFGGGKIVSHRTPQQFRFAITEKYLP
jgi:hypothetical protein